MVQGAGTPGLIPPMAPAARAVPVLQFKVLMATGATMTTVSPVPEITDPVGNLSLGTTTPPVPLGARVMSALATVPPSI